MKQYDTLVVIGRFEPVHNAHVEIFRRAATLAKHVIVIVGSANQPRTYKNPWTSAERHMMLTNILESKLLPDDFSYEINHNTDTIYNNDAWAARVQSIVSKSTRSGPNVGIIGHKKDETSFYLDMFPQWKLVEVESIQPLNATDVRDLYFRRDVNMNFIRGVVPPSTANMLEGWINSPDFNAIIEEREFHTEHDKQYASLKYPPIFVTSDAVVLCAGHVLMIKRRAIPGKGLWALPGGYVNAKTDASVRDAMLRELREETGIKVPRAVLTGSIIDEKVFDAVNRSLRGRIITHAFKIVLPSGELPKVKGMDDAEKAKWIPIGELDTSMIFEDHYDIIQWAVGA